MSAISLPDSLPRINHLSRLLIPTTVGTLAALGMLGVYLAVLTVLQSPAHALEQLTTDGVWVALVALGFGIQIALYTHLRLVIRAAQAAGATAMTGAGTGTSTLGMLACCAHHLTGVAPLISLTGTSGLAGAIGFFTEWKYAFIGFGLIMNALGVLVTLRTIRRCILHLASMNQAETVPLTEPAPACH